MKRRFNWLFAVIASQALPQTQTRKPCFLETLIFKPAYRSVEKGVR